MKTLETVKEDTGDCKRMLKESVEKDIIIVVQNTRPKFFEELRILIEEEII